MSSAAFMASAAGTETVGRLAPSPTGALHLGHARSFLVAWWLARQAKGRLVLRQEDLDAQRCTPAFRDLVLTDLEWLGIDWDGREWLQSERLEVYEACAIKMLEQGLAYPCVCSRGDIQAAVRAPHAGEPLFKYPGTCRNRYSSLGEAERRSGKPAGLRALAPDLTVEFEDGLAGRVTQNLANAVGDFLIMRRDKVPSYQLAVVIDDAAQKVNTIVRGDDLLESTARQLYIGRCMKAPVAKYFHVPLVTDARGNRLAKRSAGLSLQELRNAGVDPRRIVQWVAQTCGMNAPELASAHAFLSEFNIKAVLTKTVAAPVAAALR